MRDHRVPWLVFATLLALWLAGAPTAWAAARVVVPGGWSASGDAAPEAQRRAERWREALGLRLSQVVASREPDRFAETVAVFERAEPVPASVFASQDDAVATLSSTVAAVVGAQPPRRTELRTLSNGAQVVWAQWPLEDLVYECVLAPSGNSSSVIVFAVQARDLGDQRTTIDNMIAGLEGVTQPMPAFSLNSWRVVSILAWLAQALMLHALMLAFVDRERDHRQAGTRASGISLVLVIVVTVIAALILRPMEAALIYAGSVTSLVVWIGVSGLVVVGVHFLIVTRFDHGVVRSAPASGAFASGTYSSTDLIRASVTRTGMRKRAEDIAAGSGSWPRANLHGDQARTQAQAAQAGAVPAQTEDSPSGSVPHGAAEPGAGASQSARIVIDAAERER